MTQLLPGQFGGSAPDMPPPPPPPPKFEDPEIMERKRRERMSVKQRRGRAATILAPDEDDLGAANVDRPAAGGAQILG